MCLSSHPFFPESAALFLFIAPLFLVSSFLLKGTFLVPPFLVSSFLLKGTFLVPLFLVSSFLLISIRHVFIHHNDKISSIPVFGFHFIELLLSYNCDGQDFERWLLLPEIPTNTVMVFGMK